MSDYPKQSGDVTVLGPETFINAENTVISYKGQNFYSLGGFDATESVILSQKEYDSLVESDRQLTALDDAGVDNWEGNRYRYLTDDEDNW